MRFAGLKVLAFAAASLTALSSAAAGAPPADAVDVWSNEVMDTIRAKAGGPGISSRVASMVHVAMYDAINSIRGTHTPIVAKVAVTRPANQRAAIAQAARDVLVHLYPDRTATYDGILATELAAVGAVPGRNNGINVGKAAAAAVIAARTNDGSAVPESYTFGTNPGDYVHPDPGVTPPTIGSRWGVTKPWVIDSPSQFRPTGPGGFQKMHKLLASQYYANQLNEVKSLGERTSATRTADQTEIAWFWANDRPGTFLPPGHMILLTQVVANQEGVGLFQKARLLALVMVAQSDTCLTVWDCKFETNIDLWRPVTAIQNADLDNNPNTTKQADWVPLLDFTPPFPAYPSGHSSFGASNATILRNFFGRDNISFTLGTDEPGYTHITRSFTSFTQAALENAISRIYLGVHYRFDADTSYAIGSTVAQYVYNKTARPNCEADFNGDGIVNARDVTAYTSAYFSGNTLADVTGDSQVNSIDFYRFIDSYLRGCNAN